MKMSRLLSSLSLLLLGSWVSAECGYDSCPKTVPGALNVHLVPHTHDDVGWLKNVDEYYYGSKKDITPVGVQYILDSVIPELVADPNKRFIYVEMAFFFRWWSEQGDRVRHQVRDVVRRGQLEFILGGWCMNDEAAAHYNAIVDQMAWGLKRLNDTFGSCAVPSVAWQIDPFGHSREQANLFAQMGFDGLFFGRLDYQDKDKRLKDKTMEMVWRGSDSLGKSSWLFTGALFNGYGPPSGFCFDIFCDDDPIRDDPRLSDYNLDAKVDAFLSAAREQAASYATDHIVMTMGSDFNYVSANSWYKNLDKLIAHVNSRQDKVHLLYSTPSCYLKSLHESGKEWPTKSDDFFPYASDPHAYWTGYFTSRPTLKRMVRYGNNFLQACKQVDALTNRDWSFPLEGDVTVMREAMGVLQHHDAVSGTAKQAVTDDYALRLDRGLAECGAVIAHGYQVVGAVDGADKVRFCHLSNITECAPTSENENGNNLVVSVYNPLARNVSKHIRLPVSPPSLSGGGGFHVLAPNGDVVQSQLVPLPTEVLLIPGRVGGATHELVFRVDLPPLGFKSFFVERTAKYERHQLSKVTRKRKRMAIDNGAGFVVTTDATGALKSARHGGSRLFELRQKFAYYEAHAGRNVDFADRASGAYIFRPASRQPTSIPIASATRVSGPIVQEIHQSGAGGFVSQVVRIYSGTTDAELEWMVGPVPVSDGVGKEVVSRFVTDIDSGDAFYTDSNGRQMIERRRDSRPTWRLNVTEPVAGNYYPVNSRIAVRGRRSGDQLTVLTDRSQGGSSLASGELELMLHRRLLWDDAFGVGEPLNESAYGQGLVARGKHWAQLSLGGAPEADGNAARRHRMGAMQKFMDAVVSFVDAGGATFQEWRSAHAMERSALLTALPEQVHLLTMENWNGNSRDSVLLRFEHYFDRDEDDELSADASFDLDEVFVDFAVSAAREVTLGANLWAGERQRLEWKVEETNELEEGRDEQAGQQPLDVTGPGPKVIKLTPMQIRSFVVDLEPRKKKN